MIDVRFNRSHAALYNQTKSLLQMKLFMKRDHIKKPKKIVELLIVKNNICIQSANTLS